MKEMHAYVGVDVSKDTLDVTLLTVNGGKRRKRVANTSSGRQALLDWLQNKRKGMLMSAWNPQASIGKG